MSIFNKKITQQGRKSGFSIKAGIFTPTDLDTDVNRAVQLCVSSRRRFEPISLRFFVLDCDGQPAQLEHTHYLSKISISTG
ncbi:hypothetical protein [Pseudomonas gingeri]|uniref:hypothetical protein n=1 Tax=Pseudomonas gingeri TaxID=117681 RepID=UPI0015C10A38|nr:hypothetical protein [Pseudomonas gingeri]NWD50558.1 hypothetical protein [Pseudomonas gingeri]